MCLFISFQHILFSHNIEFGSKQNFQWLIIYIYIYSFFFAFFSGREGEVDLTCAIGIEKEVDVSKSTSQ